MAKPTLFVSHIADEAALALILRDHLARDFLGMVEIFVSSDSASISAGDNWLKAIEEALSRARVELVLCSKASVTRPWINFEAGAGWNKGIPIIPVCHSGLRPADLPMPLRVLQAVIACDADGISMLYKAIAKALDSRVPQPPVADLLGMIAEFEQTYSPRVSVTTSAQQQREFSALERMKAALRDEKYIARSVRRLAVLGGVSESEALDILRSDPDVVFDSSKSLGRLVKLKSRQEGAS